MSAVANAAAKALDLPTLTGGLILSAAQAQEILGEHELIRRYSAVLTRYSGQWALAGAELACWGPVDRVLGLAHAAFGRLDDAHAMLTSALQAATAQGAAPWVVRCAAGLDGLAASSR